MPSGCPRCGRRHGRIRSQNKTAHSQKTLQQFVVVAGRDDKCRRCECRTSTLLDDTPKRSRRAYRGPRRGAESSARSGSDARRVVRRRCFPGLVFEVRQEHVERAFKIARWYGRRARRAEISDLESAALEGLAKAARDWDPHARTRRVGRGGRKLSFWSFAFKRILGEMKDELRRFDHLTRDQRAMVAEHGSGELLVEQEGLSWINPREPLPLDASVTREDSAKAGPIMDLIEGPHNPIEEFELLDAFCRAGADLPRRERFVVVKREIEGYSNGELAEALEVTQGRASQLLGAALEQMQRQIGDSFLDAA